MEPISTWLGRRTCQHCTNEVNMSEGKKRDADSTFMPWAVTETSSVEHSRQHCDRNGQRNRTFNRGYSYSLCSSVIYSYLYYLLLLSVFISVSEPRPLSSEQDSKQAIRRTRRSPQPISGSDYLATFGYLPASDLETGALRTQEEVAQALRSFQRMAHIPQTGQFDAATQQKMDDDRCGVPDPKPSQFRSRAKRYVLGPSHWDKQQLTYGVLNNSPDLDHTETMHSLRQAFALWSEVTKLDFQQSYYAQEADMQISFGRQYHNDGYPFDGPGRILAHAFYPGPGQGGDLHFDEDEYWTYESFEGTNLFIVAAHEMGHALGLAHSDTLGSLMYPWYQGYVENFELHQDDIYAIRQLYGYRDNSWRPTPDRRPPTEPVTIPTTTTTTTRPWDGRPNPCTTSIDAISQIRGELFAFSGKWFWRIGDTERQYSYLIELQSFWTALPRNVDRIDAIYERVDGNIVVFRGDRYWMLISNSQLHPSVPRNGFPLSRLGLSPDVQKIDAAFVWGKNKRTYLISGDKYWRLDDGTGTAEAKYPRGMSMWKEVPLPVDSALQYKDGHTYFFRGNSYVKFDDYSVRAIRDGYPKRIAKQWLECHDNLIEYHNLAPRTASAHYRHLLLLAGIVTLIAARWRLPF